MPRAGCSTKPFPGWSPTASASAICRTPRSSDRPSAEAIRSRVGGALSRGRIARLGSEEEKLRKFIPPERKRQIRKRASYRKQADHQHPQLSLPRGKGLSVDTGDGAEKHDQPNPCQTQPDLAVKFRGMDAEFGKNFAHRLFSEGVKPQSRAFFNFVLSKILCL